MQPCCWANMCAFVDWFYQHGSRMLVKLKVSFFNGNRRNEEVLEIYVAGQAKSHCVLESVSSMMRYFEGRPEIINKIHLLTDAMSSVYSPAVDFEAMANMAFRQFTSHGLKLTTTEEA